MSQSESSAVPQHLGLILDGNRRWARDNDLPTLKGHKKGYENLIDLADYIVSKGVKFVSAYVFSTENWDRAKEEVDYLMDLAMVAATKHVKTLNEKDIRVVIMGRTDNVSEKLLKALEKAEEDTKDNKRGTLALCFNYGGQPEIVDATKKILEDGVDPKDLDEKKFAQYLYKPEIPPCDLIIRTSGEQRLSNFQLWRSAYSELAFIDKHWPEFNEKDIDDLLEDYANRGRRFGK